MVSLPPGARFVIIGAGIHGLSTAMHLAGRLRAKGMTVGAETNRIVVLDKTGIGAGASGIACGVVRNNYYQPAMRELMAHSVSVWERDPEAYSYHPVGYMQISPEVMHAQVGTIYEQQKAIGYESVFVEGEAESLEYMRTLFSDWQAANITSVLHEKRGGYANNLAAVQGLARKAESLGVEIVAGVEVRGFRSGNGSTAINAIDTNLGTITCEQVVVAVGPWINAIWNMLELPKRIGVRGRDGKMHDAVRMWRYMALQEGTLGVDPDFLKTNDGRMPPVLHVDTDAPLRSDRDGELITDRLWGVYYKPDFHFNGVQGGAMPAVVEPDADAVRVDPYGPKSPEFVVTDNFADMWTSALAFCQKRFEGRHGVYRQEPSGGIGCFTPDSFPVFDRFRENVYVIADSNHGFKMIGVGELVAHELLGGSSDLLEPFRFSRYAQGKLHPVSNSPFPWS
jgi:glycine/D-amino acid oxidase-like deaminating enzyme